MDIQSILNMVSDMRKSTAGNLTVGSMLAKLEKFNDNEEIKLSDGRYLANDFGSYRGYYEDLAISYRLENVSCDTVGKLKSLLNKALEQRTMYGYKGGEYSIDTDTLVWVANYGDCGEMIIDIQKINGTIIIIIKEDD